jgi:hypothetical protein
MANIETDAEAVTADGQRRRRKLRFLIRIGGLLIVLCTGWVAGLKTHESVDMGQISTWMRETAAGLPSHLDAWRKETLASIGEHLIGSSARDATVSSEPAERTNLAALVERVGNDLRGEIIDIRVSSRTVQTELGTGLEELKDALERTQKQLLSKLDDLERRLDRVESLASAAVTTKNPEPSSEANGALVGQLTAARPLVQAAEVKAAPSLTSASEVKRITTWIVREVVNGTAILEGPRGIIGVSSGDLVPGAGRVESIVRRGGRWEVATSKGLITPR